MKLWLSLFFIIIIFITCPKKDQAGAKDEAITTNYQNVNIRQFPVAMQCWTFRKFTFFETLQKVKDLGIQYLEAYPGQALSSDLPDIKFDHNLSDEQKQIVKAKLNKLGIILVNYGVVGLGKDEASMAKVFDFARQMGIKTIMTEPDFEDFPLIEKMVQKYDIQVAIHNHPRPSRYALPKTVLEHVKNLDKRIGSCADTGHWMRSGVVPVEALRLLKGRIISTHLKDLNEFGVQEAYDVPFGQGKANIHDILAELTLQNFQGYLTIEYENEQEANNPSPSIKKGIEYIRSITFYEENFKSLLKQHNGRYSKHGWNHYGPGYFELDAETGILKSQGGMGLFWFSEQKFRDFVLEIDYKCSQKNSNSGIFLRIPDLPVNDSYIFHSFEIQIADDGQGIHKTGAVYDAEAPEQDAFNPTGEWNHYRITFKGNLMKVELNDQLVIDWAAEPRGKVKDFASEGYIGLQNHDHNTDAPVYFRNIYIKEL